MKTGPTVDHDTYLGGSDMAAVLGVSLYDTPLAVWAQKTGRIATEGRLDEESQLKADLGNHLERPVLELFRRRVGATVIEYPGTLIHPEFSFLGATPDGIRDGKRGVQCKVVGMRQWSRWGDVEDGPEGVPNEVVIQVHWEAWAIRAHLGHKFEVADVPALLGTDLKNYEVPIDWEMCEMMETSALQFWRDNVEADVMPLVTEDDDIAAIFLRPKREDLLQPDENVVCLVREYDFARDEEKRASSAKRLAANRLQAEIGHGTGFMGDGVKATWAEQQGNVSWKDVAAKYRHELVTEAGYKGKELNEIEEACRGKGRRSLDVRLHEEKYR